MKVLVKEIKQEEMNLIVTVDMPDDAKDQNGDPFLDFPIYLHVDALGSRMALYELDTPQEALVAIVREHVRRMTNLVDPKDRDQAVTLMKRDVDAIEVEIQCTKDIDGLLKSNQERIKYSYMVRAEEVSE